MISQKTNVAKVQALQMAQKRNEIELKTAELKKERQDKKTSAAAFYSTCR